MTGPSHGGADMTDDMIETTHGPLHRSELTRLEVPTERGTATEWYLGDELVRRDAAAGLTGINGQTVQGRFA
jgi:hypothetical protein